VFTSGLINSLDPKELEAVAAHELSHIINKDSLLMLVTVVFIGIISVLGEILIRVRIGGDSKDTRVQMITMVVGLVCLVLGYLMYPLIRLAISRKREFLADAGAVELMKDSQAMISALQKISGHSFVPSAKKQIAMFFINSPVGTSKKSSSIRDTHPSIDERIEALQHF
jgi:heat shock protein HtpX